MLALEENQKRQLEVEISRLTLEKNEANKVARRMESTMNRVLHQAKLQQKDKCLDVLSQCHVHFNRLMEVSGCETFCLRWEQALLDPLARVFLGLKEYDALNKVESKNMTWTTTCRRRISW